MSLRTALLFSLIIGPLPCMVEAQPTGDCVLGTASAELDVNGVRARLFNKGNLFFDGGDPNYEIPKGSGVHSVFAAGVWIGGLVEGELRIAAGTYAQGGEDYEFYPGPLNADGSLPQPHDCTPYDRIYTVTRADLARYDEHGIATDDLAEWPAELGAPFWDADGDGAYDLAAGDRPKVWGDQTAWWVMNDAGGPHLTTRSEPIGLEVRVTAFAAALPVEALRYTTFYRYELTYRGTGEGSAPLDSAYFGSWNDYDLGNFNDDYIGTDSIGNLVYVYNADDDDEGDGGYGTAPPAQGTVILEGPLALPNGIDDDGDGTVDENGERLRATSASYVKKSSSYAAHVDVGYYNYLRCRWGDIGEHWRYGFTGVVPGQPPTCWVYPGEVHPAPSYWSEFCPTTDCATPIPSADRRGIVSTGPFRMEPGETAVVTLAYVWARGESNLHSVHRMKVASEFVERAYRLGVLDPVAPTSVEPEPPEGLALAGPFPNPFGAEAAFRLRVPEGAGAVRVAAYDVLGREVALLHEGALPPGEHTLRLDGAALPAGLYFVRFAVAGGTRTLKAIHVE